MLKSLFAWLDSHPGGYWVVAGAVTALLAYRVWVALRENTPAGQACSWGRRIGDALVLFVFVLGWRWPYLLAANDYNPDESQLIAGAITLAHDPVFWRSVDGTTSGPLNFYVLLPWHWLGLPLDYFTARLAALIMIGVALFACHRALTRAFGRVPAWLGVLPAAGFFATVSHADLIHYSSEHLSLMLSALAFWFLAERQPSERFRLWLGCAIAGAAPWAKLQSAPIGLALIVWALWQELSEPGATRTDRWRRAGSVVLAAALPTLVATVLIAATGQLETAVRRYFLQNVFYVQSARPLGTSLHEMLKLALVDGRAPWMLGISSCSIAAAGLYYAVRRVRPPQLFLAGAVVLAATVLAVLTPRREFLHYFLLLPVPLTICAGAGLGGWWTRLGSIRSRLMFGIIVALAGSLPFVATRCLQPRPEMIGQFINHWRHPRTGTAVVIRALAGPDDCLAIWGWANNLYVETALRQAVPTAHNEWCITPNAQRDYQRAEYLRKVREQQPAVFVDAVGSGAFAFEYREIQAHETFGELRDYIDHNYQLVVDLGSARIYGRKELPVLAGLTPARIDELLARGRVLHSLGIPHPSRLTSIESWPRRIIGQQEVLMLLPPAEIVWSLESEVREVELKFGFDPVAYERGQSNGAEVILELVDGGRTRPLFHRLLDPARQNADRGVQTAVVPLPPFEAGARLVLRSAPGENNDNAWDWVYLASLTYRNEPHFLASQFPQFNRAPDFARAGLSVIYSHAGHDTLSFPAPSMVGYVLDGTERRLRFEFGFEEGAYSNGGNTDGAIFRVERERPNQTAVVLFERFLRPQAEKADRGTQRADIDLAGSARGDRLVIRIDPGPAQNASWDWTFLDQVELGH